MTQQPSLDAGTAGARPPLDAGTPSGDDASLAQGCSSQTRPGDACDSRVDGQCGVSHCGARNTLECRDGHWIVAALPWQAASSPFDFACAPEQELAGSFCTAEVQCCGQPVAQPTGCPIEGGCGLCPSAAPADGEACTLPEACDGQPEPPVIDCYYKCCCYGQATWAQCDGTRWRLNTECTPK